MCRSYPPDTADSWADVLQVRIDLPDHDSAELPAMVGDYRVVEGDAERTVRLTPTEEWTNGPYRLAVYPTLEDFAGNRVESVFDMAPGTVAGLEATAAERRPAYIEIEVIAAPL